MDDRIAVACEHTVALSAGTGYDLSRIVLKQTDDNIQVTMLLRSLVEYGVLLQDPACKDRLMSLFFTALRQSGFVMPEEPRFSFRFTADI